LRQRNLPSVALSLHYITLRILYIFLYLFISNICCYTSCILLSIILIHLLRGGYYYLLTIRRFWKEIRLINR